MKKPTYLASNTRVLFFVICLLAPTVFAQSIEGALVPIVTYLLSEQESDKCIKAVDTGQTVTGVLSSECAVDELAEKYYTRFYRFSLDEDAEVLISVERVSATGADPHVVLREGAEPDGEELFFADASADGQSWRIEAELESDDFTIEISSVEQKALDSFTLSVGKIIR